MSDKSKNYILFGIIIGVVFLISIIVFMTVNFVTASSYDKINIFGKIQECNALNEYVSDKEISDKYISDDLHFVNSYVYEVNLQSNDFIIYAYKFDSVETTKQYFSRINGNTVDGDIDYKSNSSLFSSSLIVRYENNVLRIKTGGTQEYIKIMKFLNSIFTVNVREQN